VRAAAATSATADVSRLELCSLDWPSASSPSAAAAPRPALASAANADLQLASPPDAATAADAPLASGGGGGDELIGDLSTLDVAGGAALFVALHINALVVCGELGLAPTAPGAVVGPIVVRLLGTGGFLAIQVNPWWSRIPVRCLARQASGGLLAIQVIHGDPAFLSGVRRDRPSGQQRGGGGVNALVELWRGGAAARRRIAPPISPPHNLSVTTGQPATTDLPPLPLAVTTLCGDDAVWSVDAMLDVRACSPRSVPPPSARSPRAAPAAAVSLVATATTATAPRSGASRRARRCAGSAGPRYASEDVVHPGCLPSPLRCNGRNALRGIRWTEACRLRWDHTLVLGGAAGQGGTILQGDRSHERCGA
jgi:hypothetical protein